MSSRVKLSGELPGTTCWVEIRRGGDLVIEHYDHSPDAEATFGNDVAYFVRVAPQNLDTLVARLITGVVPPAGDARERLVIKTIAERFAGYYALIKWLDDNSIPYTKTFDAWA